MLEPLIAKVKLGKIYNLVSHALETDYWLCVPSMVVAFLSVFGLPRLVGTLYTGITMNWKAKLLTTVLTSYFVYLVLFSLIYPPSEASCQTLENANYIRSWVLMPSIPACCLCSSIPQVPRPQQVRILDNVTVSVPQGVHCEPLTKTPTGQPVIPFTADKLAGALTIQPQPNVSVCKDENVQKWAQQLPALGCNLVTLASVQHSTDSAVSKFMVDCTATQLADKLLSQLAMINRSPPTPSNEPSLTFTLSSSFQWMVEGCLVKLVINRQQDNEQVKAAVNDIVQPSAHRTDFKATQAEKSMQVSKGAHDFLLVVDNSGTMASNQDHLAKIGDVFFQELNKICLLDWRIGRITTDQTRKNRKFVVLGPTSSQEEYQDTIKVGTSGHDVEMAAWEAETFLKNSKSFPLDWNQLSVLVVTDEEHQAPENWKIEDNIFTQRNIPVHIFYEPTQPSTDFEKLCRVTKGSCAYLNLNKKATSQQLQSVVELIAAKASPYKVEVADIGMSVLLNGAPLSENNWRYVPAHKSIIFFGPNCPKPADTIKIWYQAEAKSGGKPDLKK